jgi:hypothetical protein
MHQLFNKIRHFQTIPPHHLIDVMLKRRLFLKRIAQAQPISNDPKASIEVHMLLHHQRVFHAVWTLYSFAFFCEDPCQMIIHDDGSLTGEDKGILSKTFPGCLILSRQKTDSEVAEYLGKQKLSRCADMRRNFIFALKFFDPWFYSSKDNFLLIDSDILFFSKPEKLIEGLDGSEHRSLPGLYSRYDEYGYCLEEPELRKILGRDCVHKLNAGLLRANRSILDLQRVERHLSNPGFITDRGYKGPYDWYSEQTLWAMEMTLADSIPLSADYAIAEDPSKRKLVSSHYCGGLRSWRAYYLHGLPYLSKILLKP